MARPPSLEVKYTRPSAKAQPSRRDETRPTGRQALADHAVAIAIAGREALRGIRYVHPAHIHLHARLQVVAHVRALLDFHHLQPAARAAAVPATSGRYR